MYLYVSAPNKHYTSLSASVPLNAFFKINLFEEHCYKSSFKPPKDAGFYQIGEMKETQDVFLCVHKWDFYRL